MSEQLIEFQDVNNNVIVQTQQSRVFIVSFTDEITYDTVNGILKELQRESITEADRLEIHISCHGGDLDASVHFMNIVLLLFGANISTFITSHAYSAAAFIFMLGNQRFIYEEASIMLHIYSSGGWGKATENHNYYSHNTKKFKRLLKKYYGEFLTKKEFKKIMRGEDVYLDAEELVDKKIATNIFTVDFGDRKGINGEDDGEV